MNRWQRDNVLHNRYGPSPRAGEEVFFPYGYGKVIVKIRAFVNWEEGSNSCNLGYLLGCPIHIMFCLKFLIKWKVYIRKHIHTLNSLWIHGHTCQAACFWYRMIPFMMFQRFKRKILPGESEKCRNGPWVEELQTLIYATLHVQILNPSFSTYTYII